MFARQCVRDRIDRSVEARRVRVASKAERWVEQNEVVHNRRRDTHRSAEELKVVCSGWDGHALFEEECFETFLGGLLSKPRRRVVARQRDRLLRGVQVRLRLSPPRLGLRSH